MLTKWHYAAMQDVYKLVGDHKDRTQDASGQREYVALHAFCHLIVQRQNFNLFLEALNLLSTLERLSPCYFEEC